jgi:hypothetical protein
MDRLIRDALGGIRMQWRKLIAGRLMLGLAVLVAFLSGCNRGLPYREQPPAAARIQKFAALCNSYARQQRKKPSSMGDLKAFAKTLKKSDLEHMGIDDLEAAFVSPRDNQPYVFVKSNRSGPGDVLAYEKTGEGGKHYIVTPMGSVFELDEAELQRRLSLAK